MSEEIRVGDLVRVIDRQGWSCTYAPEFGNANLTVRIGFQFRVFSINNIDQTCTYMVAGRLGLFPQKVALTRIEKIGE